ncbi:MAG: NAD(+) synthase, partial [Corynebacterium sp.]|uniref:nitrilase-related carbon-nitrogen hydrolase n=1 Tax=Corynebacterium sp. TaxID=1720 RepID=UPI002649DE7D
MTDAQDRDFRNLYRHGFARVAACTLPVTMADPFANAEATLEQVRHLHDEGVAVALFPELGLTGYSIDDLLLQDVLLRDVEAALVHLANQMRDLTPLIAVGAPLRHRNRLYNCAVLIHRGEI